MSRDDLLLTATDPRHQASSSTPRLRAATDQAPAPALPLVPSRYLGLALLLAIGTRVAVLLVSALSVNLAEPDTFSAKANGKVLMAWDSLHYYTITVEGYPDTYPPLIAFFPLYPLLARCLTVVVAPDVALLLISNVATVLAAVFVFLWAATWTEPRTALWCTALTLVYPPALFYSAAYTEGLFLLATALVLWLLPRSGPWPVACLSGLATALRPTGVALAALVVWSSLRQTLASRNRTAWVRLLCLSVVSVSGILIYQLFLWHQYQRVDVYFRAQDEWIKPEEATFPEKVHLVLPPLQDRLPPPLRPFVSFINWNRLCVALILTLTVVGFFQPGPIPRYLFLMPLLIFLLAYLPGHGARMASLARFETVALPCFLLAAMRLRQWRGLGWVAVMAFAVQLFYAWEFSRGRWMG